MTNTTINQKLSIRDNIIPIIVDKENMRITAGNLVIKEYRNLRTSSAAAAGEFLPKTPACVTTTVRVLPPLKNFHGGHPESTNKTLTENLGMTPKRYYNLLVAKMIEVYVDPWEDFILKYCRGHGGRLSEGKVNAFHRNKEMLYQAQKDGQHNIIPILMSLEENPKDLKQRLGKGTWKYLCSNSYTRNVKIAPHLVCRYLDFSDKKKVIDHSKNYPTSVLDHVLCNTTLGDEASWTVESLRKDRKLSKTSAADFKGIVNTYRDTRRMSEKLGLSWKPNKWSIEEMNKIHDEYSEKITNLKYSKDFLECLKGFEREFTYKNYKAELLTSRFDIAQEGKEMKHCVASYAEKVARGDYLVYSIKDCTGKKVSTLGVHRQVNYKHIKPASGTRTVVLTPQEYSISQHYGKCNAHIKDETLKSLAKELVNKLNKKPEGEENVEDTKEIVREGNCMVPLPMWEECTFD